MSKEQFSNIHRYMGQLLLRGYRDGRPFTDKHYIKPYLFQQTKDKNPKYKSIYGDHLERVDFGTASEATKFKERYKDVSNWPLFGMDTWQYPFLNDHYPGKIEFDMDLINRAFVDIENDSEGGFANLRTADKEITLITHIDQRGIHTFASQPLDIEIEDCTYHSYPNEKAMLIAYINHWAAKYPDIISGWNSSSYDIVYIINRLKRIFGDDTYKKLSPWNIVDERKVFLQGEEQQFYTIAGIADLDYLILYKDQKFQLPKQESYKLDHIAYVELGTRKVDYEEYGSLHEFAKQNWPKFVQYNVRDAKLVQDLDAKLKLLDIVIAVAYEYKMNFEDVLTSVKMWDIIIHNYLMAQNIIIPFKKDAEKVEIIGGYVKDPIKGMYEWPVSMDMTSLYPSIMMTLNISPDVLDRKVPGINADVCFDRQIPDPILEECKIKNLAMGANGQCFRKDKLGFMTALVLEMFTQRAQYKKLMLQAKRDLEKDPTNKTLKNLVSRYNNSQMALKIALNSLYGTLGNVYNRYYNPSMAEAITATGQLVIRWIERSMNKYLNKVIETKDTDYIVAIDTDSVFMNLGPLMKKILKEPRDVMAMTELVDKICKTQIEPKIDSCLQEMVSYLPVYQNKLSMKREKISSRAIWTGKKRYILNVIDDEGVRYSKPKLKMTGIEAIRSTTPQICKDAIKEVLEIIMTGDEKATHKYNKDFRKKFKASKIEEISQPMGANNLQKYSSPSTIYGTKTPVQVKAALLHNHLLREKGLDKQIHPIMEGEKIKFCYLKEPNIIQDEVIGFVGTLPKEFGLEPWIDYDMMYEKTYGAAIERILDACGWSENKKHTIEGLFG